MDEDEKERINEIVDSLNKDLEMPPYNTGSKRVYSRQYKQYQEEEKHERQKTRFERMCIWFGNVFSISADEEIQEKLSPPLRLLQWDITPGMVLSAAIGVGFISFLVWGAVFALNMMLGELIPTSMLFILGLIPVGAGVYTFYKPIYAAKNKVIRSSSEMIMSVLYIVIYLRSTPNLEGAVRFAALNLEGPIADDLKGVLWDLEVGNFKNISQSLEHYTKAWKDYNDDFLESLQLLNAAVNEPNSGRRDTMLQDSIDRILDGTQEKMKHYAQSLKMPVMIINALGAMLPVLSMIMLPLLSGFMGDTITPFHLVFTFNILLPATLYWFMQRVLSSRPPTVSSEPTSKGSLSKLGVYKVDIRDTTFEIPTWTIGAFIFFLISLYGFIGYFIFPYFFPISDKVAKTITYVPGIFDAAEGYAEVPMLLRSLSITAGLGLGIGISKVLGSLQRKKEEEKLEKIEGQFPTALFQLGNEISGGTPIESALNEAADSTSDMEISGLFRYASRNVRDMGMTFEKAVFDPKYGALKEYPSQMIHTVMKAILKSSEKGNKMAAMAMTTISHYLDNIHKTQEQLNDLLEETTTTIQMLAYILAPIVSGVAVGMSQTIITAMFKLGGSFNQVQGNLPGSGATGGAQSYSKILGGFQNAISPEILQFVVGIYLIQLLYILGTFFMKIKKGESQTFKTAFIGKILISGMIFYSLSLMIVVMLFGGMMSGLT